MNEWSNAFLMAGDRIEQRDKKKDGPARENPPRKDSINPAPHQTSNRTPIDLTKEKLANKGFNLPPNAKNENNDAFGEQRGHHEPRPTPAQSFQSQECNIQTPAPMEFKTIEFTPNTHNITHLNTEQSASFFSHETASPLNHYGFEIDEGVMDIPPEPISNKMDQGKISPIGNSIKTILFENWKLKDELVKTKRELKAVEAERNYLRELLHRSTLQTPASQMPNQPYDPPVPYKD